MSSTAVTLAASPPAPRRRRPRWLAVFAMLAVLILLAAGVALSGAVHAPPITISVDGQTLWHDPGWVDGSVGSVERAGIAFGLVLALLVAMVVLPLVLFCVLAVVGLVLLAVLGLPLLLVVLVLALLASPLLLLGWLVWRLAS